MKKNLILFAMIFLSSSFFAQNKRPVVNSIVAEGSAWSKIAINWNLPKQDSGVYIHSFLIYRDNKPISTYSALHSLKPVATLPAGSHSYVDTVDDRREYFYAVVSVLREGVFVDPEIQEPLYYDEELDAKPEDAVTTILDLVLPGVNATVNGAKGIVVKKKPEIIVTKQKEKRKFEDDKMREQPLPFIDVLGDEEEHEHKISKATQNKVNSLTKKSAKKNAYILEPYIFEQDIVSSPSGDEYLLFEVLKTTFIKNDFKGAITYISMFLAQNRNPQVTDRANFYLGQSYYFTGNFEKALQLFLSLSESYPALSNKWIQSTLDLYEIENK